MADFVAPGRRDPVQMLLFLANLAAAAAIAAVAFNEWRVIDQTGLLLAGGMILFCLVNAFYIHHTGADLRRWQERAGRIKQAWAEPKDRL